MHCPISKETRPVPWSTVQYWECKKSKKRETANGLTSEEMRIHFTLKIDKESVANTTAGRKFQGLTKRAEHNEALNQVQDGSLHNSMGILSDSRRGWIRQVVYHLKYHNWTPTYGLALKREKRQAIQTGLESWILLPQRTLAPED